MFFHTPPISTPFSFAFLRLTKALDSSTVSLIMHKYQQITQQLHVTAVVGYKHFYYNGDPKRFGCKCNSVYCDCNRHSNHGGMVFNGVGNGGGNGEDEGSTTFTTSHTTNSKANSTTDVPTFNNLLDNINDSSINNNNNNDSNDKDDDKNKNNYSNKDTSESSNSHFKSTTTNTENNTNTNKNTNNNKNKPKNATSLQPTITPQAPISPSSTTPHFLQLPYISTSPPYHLPSSHKPLKSPNSCSFPSINPPSFTTFPPSPGQPPDITIMRLQLTRPDTVNRAFNQMEDLGFCNG